MLLFAFLPWTLLAVAVCAQRSGTPASLTSWVRDILPDGALKRWSASFPVLTFTSGFLLAFALVQVRVCEIAEVADAEHVDGPVETPAHSRTGVLVENGRDTA